MTWRYLQSMSSKCLILGRMPHEMRLLFDYDPILEIDFTDPAGQLRAILKSFDTYAELIERNYRCVQEHHQWPNRIASIERYLEEVNATDQRENVQGSVCSFQAGDSPRLERGEYNDKRS